MTSDESGSIFGVGVIFGLILSAVVFGVGSCDATTSRRKARSAQACRPHRVLSAGDSIAVCTNGSVFRWREGYLTPVGKKR